MKKHTKRPKAGKVVDRRHADEEYAAEVAPGRENFKAKPEGSTLRTDAGISLSIGWIALVFSIASLFFWPIIMGPTAAVLGFYAYWQGDRKTGTWSMIIGAVAFFGFLFFSR